MKIRFSLSLVLTMFICFGAVGQKADHTIMNDMFTAYDLHQLDANSLMVAASTSTKANKVDLHLLGYDLDLFNSEIISRDYIAVRGTSDNVELGTSALPLQGYTHRGGRVSLTLNENFIYGYINTRKGTIFIEPARHFDKNADNDTYVSYYASSVKDDSPKTCGVTEMSKIDAGIEESQRSVGECFEVEYAIANDWSMNSKYGGPAGAENHAIGVTNNVQTNYDDEFLDEIQFIITEQFTSSCSTCDPWTSSTDASTLLNSFRGWGNGGNFSFDYDIASIWTNRNFDGSTIGIAYVGVVCGFSRYNALQDWSSNAPLKRVMVAHEIGHNFSSFHDAGTGFIMSPSVNFTSSWSTQSQNSINNHISTRTCLSNCANSNNLPTADFTSLLIDECTDGVVEYTDASTGSPTSWNWTFPGGIPATSTEQNPTVIYPNGGSYGATLEVTNNNGSNSVTYNNLFTIIDSPFPNFGTNVNLGDVDFINLSDFANDYFWEFGDGSFSTEVEPSHTYMDDGIYTVILTASNDCGDETFELDVEIILPPEADFISNNTTQCEEEPVSFVNLSSPNSTSYLWSFPGGTPSSSTELNPSVVYADPGTYTVTLESTNSAGSDTKVRTDYITITEKPNADFGYTQNGMTFTFVNNSANATNFFWDFGDGNFSMEPNPVHTYMTTGSVIVKLLAGTDVCDDDLHEENITITMFPIASFSVPGETTGCKPFSVDFANNSANSPTSYEWIFEGGTPATSTVENPTVVFENTGSFDVTLIVENVFGRDTNTITDLITVIEEPIVDADISIDQLQVFFDNNTQYGDSYTWDFGDGNSSTDASPLHNYNEGGTYVVTLTAENECGTTSSSYTVEAYRDPQAEAQSNTSFVCPDGTVLYEDLTEQVVLSRMWTFEGGTPATSTAESVSVTYTTPGTYNVQLIVENPTGTDTLTLSNYIEVGSLPNYNVTIQNATNTIQLGGDNQNYTYDWILPDGTTTTGQFVTYNVGGNGTYQFISTGTNVCGTSTDTTNVIVTAFPEAVVTYSAGNNCSPVEVVYIAADVQDGEYTWTFDGGVPATSTEREVTVTYTEKGTYGYDLEVSNQFGTDQTSESDIIEVEVLPTAGYNGSFDGAILALQNNSQNADSYFWEFGDGTTSTEENPTHQYQMNGTYNVTLTSTNECGSATFSEDFEIVVLTPTINFGLSTTSACAPITVMISDSTGNDPTSWLWTFEGGTPATSNEQNPSVTYNEAGTYNITVEVTNAAGVSEFTMMEAIIVNDVPDVTLDIVGADAVYDFAYDGEAQEVLWDFGDGNSSNEVNPMHIYDASGTYTVTLEATNECGTTTLTEEITVIISDVEDLFEDVRISPNPNFGNFIISGLTSTSEVKIYDVVGKQLQYSSHRMGSEDRTLNLINAVPGLILVSITDNGITSVKRVIIQ